MTSSCPTRGPQFCATSRGCSRTSREERPRAHVPTTDLLLCGARLTPRRVTGVLQGSTSLSSAPPLDLSHSGVPPGAVSRELSGCKLLRPSRHRPRPRTRIAGAVESRQSVTSGGLASSAMRRADQCLARTRAGTCAASRRRPFVRPPQGARQGGHLPSHGRLRAAYALLGPASAERTSVGNGCLRCVGPPFFSPSSVLLFLDCPLFLYSPLCSLQASDLDSQRERRKKRIAARAGRKRVGRRRLRVARGRQGGAHTRRLGE